MSDQDLHTLLGGYATNTLTKAERDALFAAALHDQQLFDALANEHALRELLEDPAARAKIVAALGPPALQEINSPWDALLEWVRRPTHLGLAGSLATALIAILAMNYFSEEAKFPSSEHVLTEDQSLDADSPPTPSASQPKDTVRLNNQESRMKDNRNTAETSSKPSIVRQPEPPPAPPLRTEKSLSEKKKESFRGTRPQALPEPQKNFPPPSKSSQETGTQDISQTPPSERTTTDQLEARQQRLPSVISPPLEQSPPSIPAPDNNARSVLSERDPNDTQEAKINDSIAVRESMAKRSLGGQAQRGNAREMFFAGQKTEDTVSDSTNMVGAVSGSHPQPLGLRYSLLKQESQGAFNEVRPEDSFSPTDALRLTIEINQKGYVYVFYEKERGTWERVYPTLKAQAGKSQLEPIQPYSRMMLPIPRHARASQLLILFSVTAIEEFEDVQAQERIQAYISQVKRKTKEQLQTIERVSQAHNEQATYIIAPAAPEATQLLVEMTLPLQYP